MCPLSGKYILLEVQGRVGWGGVGVLFDVLCHPKLKQGHPNQLTLTNQSQIFTINLRRASNIPDLQVSVIYTPWTNPGSRPHHHCAVNIQIHFPRSHDSATDQTVSFSDIPIKHVWTSPRCRRAIYKTTIFMRKHSAFV